MSRLDAAARIRLLADSFTEHDAGLTGADPLGFDGYPEALEAAREATGLAEACVWGVAETDGIRYALVVLDFRFLGGSMGTAVGEKVARAYEGALGERLPLVAVTASGGARMQEGMAALVQMARTVEARRRHASAGLGQVTLLTSPTTGGLYASFASLADVILAEPGATVGFAGPRVVEQLTGTTPPPDVHTAEYALGHGLVDGIVARSEQRETIARSLRNLTGVPGSAHRLRALPAAASEKLPAWERLGLARDPARPKGPAVLDALLTDAIELCGDREGADDPAVVVRIGALRAGGRRVVAVAQDPSGEGRIRPAGFRKAIRAFELAGRIGAPVVSVIDTRGADPLPESEGGGIASLIARTFLAVLDCPSPTLAVVTGEGGSGGALAMAPCDRVLMWENAVFSVIAPEGAASILYRDGSRAPELAERLRITAADLVGLGIADEVVPEPGGGAQTDPARALEALAAAVDGAVESLAGEPSAARRTQRGRRWRRTPGPR